MSVMSFTRRISVAVVLFCAASQPLLGDTFAERMAACLGCHGENGQSPPLGPFEGDPHGAGERAGLLVGRAREEDVAPEAGDRVRCRIATGSTGLRDEPCEHAHLERDHALHVDGAAAVDIAVGDVRCERIVAPALGRGGHDVEVGQEQQRIAAGAITPEPGVDRPAPGDWFDDLRLGVRDRSAARRGSARRGARRRARRRTGGLTDGMRMRSRSVVNSSRIGHGRAPTSRP